MAMKALNFKLDESKVNEIKLIASVFHMTMTEVINEALNQYIPEMKADPLYRLTANVENASAEETQEILAEIENLSEEDLEIAKVKKFRA